MPQHSNRKRSLEILTRKGFSVAPSLPTRGPTKLRPHEEIAARLMALRCLFIWGSFSEKEVATPRLKQYRDRNRLAEWLTDEENAILSLSRGKARERHVDNIGWKLENMWPLAWALGFEPEPAVDGGMIEVEVTGPMVTEFLPGLDTSVDDLLGQASPRPAKRVLELEDLYYCAHNAVRSAQLGGDTVPAGFHPITDGGVVHERRHALTWCVSPGVDWDDTDLST